MRKNVLATGEIYHIFTRSIANYVVFNNLSEYEHMRKLFKYYSIENDVKFSDFLELKLVNQNGFYNACDTLFEGNDKIVQIIAYSIMPTHIHLTLKQLKDEGISRYMKNNLISYTRYFNILHGRKGPLWESRFNSVLVESDEQLLHLTRYQHLNAVTAKIVEKPEDWEFSSYKEYLNEVKDKSVLCEFKDLMDINPKQYKKFVNDQIGYQRELAIIKKLLLD